VQLLESENSYYTAEVPERQPRWLCSKVVGCTSRMGSDDVTLRITGFMDIVHCPEYYITSKNNISENQCVSVFK
jgi:hypothetical protein